MTEPRSRLEDVGAIALSLPEVEQTTARGGRPAYAVGGKSFVFSREPRGDAVDPDTGQRMEDVLVFHVPDLTDKDALVAADGPFFTTPHWDGYRAVLLRERDLGQVTRRELEEIITDAWLARAPKRLAKRWLSERDRTG